MANRMNVILMVELTWSNEECCCARTGSQVVALDCTAFQRAASLFSLPILVQEENKSNDE